MPRSPPICTASAFRPRGQLLLLTGSPRQPHHYLFADRASKDVHGQVLRFERCVVVCCILEEVPKEQALPLRAAPPLQERHLHAAITRSRSWCRCWLCTPLAPFSESFRCSARTRQAHVARRCGRSRHSDRQVSFSYRPYRSYELIALFILGRELTQCGDGNGR